MDGSFVVTFVGRDEWPPDSAVSAWTYPIHPDEGGASDEIDPAYDRQAGLGCYAAAMCQYCDEPLRRTSLSGLCRKCAAAVRDDADHWGRKVRACERLLAA
jgi:hypothetical protein